MLLIYALLECPANLFPSHRIPQPCRSVHAPHQHEAAIPGVRDGTNCAGMSELGHKLQRFLATDYQTNQQKSAHRRRPDLCGYPARHQLVSPQLKGDFETAGQVYSWGLRGESFSEAVGWD